LPRTCKWPARIREWWRDIWASPIAAEWDPVIDFQAVYRLGSLYAALEGDVSAALHAQCARLESELGLSPKARKQMYLRVAEAEAAATGGASKKAPAKRPAKKGADVRDLLFDEGDG
jgi:hypothetical protein